MQSPSTAAECIDGPPIVAFRGSDEPQNDFRLGTREIDWHRHARGQFFWLDSGQAQIRTPSGSWLLPPHFAGWIPPRVTHSATFKDAISGWGMLLTPAASSGLPDEPCIMNVSELMQALVRRLVAWDQVDSLSPEQQRLLAVLHDELRLANCAHLHLSLPSDRRLLRITRFLCDHPEDVQPLAQLARMAGLSERTARRLFTAETGMSFVQWKQQLRLVMSLERLARGQSVGDVSHALGYASPSGFIAAFRQRFGQPPRRYIAGARRATSPASLGNRHQSEPIAPHPAADHRAGDHRKARGQSDPDAGAAEA